MPPSSKKPTGKKPRKRKAAPKKAATAKKKTGGAKRGAAVALCRVVGLGASAGGLEAANAVLSHLSRGQGVGVVLVTHLSPDHESLLSQILGRDSTLPVVGVEEGMRLEADRVYVAPPGVVLGFEKGCFKLSLHEKSLGTIQVDQCFRALAREFGERVTGVVLSGSGTDGSAGLREIKEHGGVAIAQSPSSAVYDSMPQSAIRTGVVDLVLDPEQIGPYLLTGAEVPEVEAVDVEGSSGMARIFKLLRARTGIDFRAYKESTLGRRLTRRMALRKVSSLDDYASLLEKEPEETNRLGEDLIIQVTKFFRAPASYAFLAEKVFPKLVEGRAEGAPLRIWIPGCATGEEAYSTAITLLERFPTLRDEVGALQIFGTDVSDTAIDFARAGVYPSSISEDVSEERRNRFFRRVDHGYRIDTSIRELCVFARQDLTHDPPFSRIDLILCRNLLIYLRPPVQQKVLRVLHYALRPGGFLLLGDSETVGPLTDAFAVGDKSQRLYTKRPGVGGAPLDLGPVQPLHAAHAVQAEREVGAVEPSEDARLLLLDRYVRPSVVIDSELRILESFGQVGDFLRLPTGAVSLRLLSMAREGLSLALRRAIFDARREWTTSFREGVHIEGESKTEVVDISVIPLGSSPEAGRMLVTFERRESRPASRRVARHGASSAASSLPEAQRLRELEADLDATRSHMAAMIQDLEAANEELQSANEEILSSNEELQSTNEELDTAREELQSTNEEITTVNEELHSRNEELVRANSDLENLLNNVPAAIVIVSRDLRVRRFTPHAQVLLNLLETDIGRPIGQIRPALTIPDFEDRIADVIRNVKPYESEIPDEKGRKLTLLIRPYKDAENRIEGGVISLLDVTLLRSHEQALSDARRLTDAVANSQGGGFALLDASLRVRWADRGFGQIFGADIESLIDRSFVDLGGTAWGERVESRLLELLDEDPPAGIEVELTLRPRRKLVVEARAMLGGTDQRQMLVAVRELGD